MKLLFLTSRFPYPLEKGDKLRAYELIKHLSDYHEITLFALNDSHVSTEQISKLQPFCKEIIVERISTAESYLSMASNYFSGIPFSVAYFYKKSLRTKIKSIIERKGSEIIFCHLIRMTEYVSDIKDVHKVLDYMDAFSAGMSRLKGKSNVFMNKFADVEHKRLLNYESKIFDAFDDHIIISKQDRDLIQHPLKNKIHVVPNGVDFNFFHPKQEEKKYDLLFAGNMNYQPNIQSVSFIIKEVLPLVKKERPFVRFVIAGANPSKEILKLDLTNVEVTGWVDDIREYFYKSKLMLAPMLISIGLQNKILQAMAMKTPCIVSTLANNAIGAEHGKEAIIADTGEDIAANILMLLNEKEKMNALAENAFQFVMKNYDWKTIVASLNEIVDDKR